jgi:hypothetical protein
MKQSGVVGRAHILPDTVGEDFQVGVNVRFGRIQETTRRGQGRATHHGGRSPGAWLPLLLWLLASFGTSFGTLEKELIPVRTSLHRTRCRTQAEVEAGKRYST